MKYFIDCEFIEGFSKWTFAKNRHFIDLISIGIVADDGRTYYAISNEYRYNDASDWVKENVIIPMYVDSIHGDMRNNCSAKNFHLYIGKSNKQIANDILGFVYQEEKIEFYGYYADYDWVLLASLFGRMIDLPKWFPMYCIDLKQTLDEKLNASRNSDYFTKFHIEQEMTLDEKLIEIKKHTQYPEQVNEHNALADAKWNYELFKFLQTL